MKKITFSHKEATSLTLVKNFLFKLITKNSANLFILGKDSISRAPQITGVHEPPITSFIKKMADIGYNGFFMDIGANIGLSSCQNGTSFNKVIAFEPNPLAVNILRVNMAIKLDDTKVEINEYGLGIKNEELCLMIPKRNWGGAFIKSSQNTYSQEILARKDGYKVIDPKNYIEKQVEVKDASEILVEKFSSLSDINAFKGVIKIDVEGMEEHVLRGISSSLPKNLKVIIIFENYDEKFPIEDILKSFHPRQAKSYVLERKLPFNDNWPWLIKIIILMISRIETKLIEMNKSSSATGDIVIMIN
tara:strand:- start:347 stop:1258 length:912 start_codon:yes stop_codon:yes gene_type:complete